MPMASAANSSARTLLHHERKSRHTRRQGKAGQSLELVSQIAKSEPSLHAGSQLTIELDAEVCDEPARLLRSRNRDSVRCTAQFPCGAWASTPRKGVPALLSVRPIQACAAWARRECFCSRARLSRAIAKATTRWRGCGRRRDRNATNAIVASPQSGRSSCARSDRCRSGAHCRFHERGELSGAASIGLDTSASVGLRHTRGRPPRGPRPAFVLRRNSTAARRETRFARN